MDYEGYVYLLINPSLKGMVGVATTNQNPEDEAEALSKSIHLPTPFIVVYQKLVCDCARIEEAVCKSIMWEAKGKRKIKDMEFFVVDITDAIDDIIECLKEEEEEYKNRLSGESEYQDSDYDDDDSVDDFNDNDVENDYNDYGKSDNDEEETPLYEMEENLGYYYQYGKNGYIQDHGEAMYHYKLAIKYGSIRAYSDIGNMYYSGNGVRKNRTTALRYLNDGVRNGYYKCYFDMMNIYFMDGEYENAVKAFHLAMEFCRDSEKVYGCDLYIWACILFKIQIPPDVVELMKPYALQMVELSRSQYEKYPENDDFRKKLQYIENELL